MKKLLLASGLLAAVGAVAGEKCESCVIKMTGCSDTHHGLQTCRIVLDRNYNNPNNCSHNDNEFIIDMSKEGGRAMFSVALAAQMSQKKVIAYGSGECSLWSSDMPRETLSYLYIVND